jgi:heme/copper-type cytochrome/quinol oxidase subunit 2
MGKRFRLILFGLAGLGVVAVPLPLPDPGPPATHMITVQADDFTYSPATIRVRPGDVVTLRFEPQDVVHGLAIDGYDVSLTADPGQPAEATFVADRSGKFRFRCSVACGSLHPFMTGELRVGPNLLFWRALVLTLLAAAGGIWLFWRRAELEVAS